MKRLKQWTSLLIVQAALVFVAVCPVYKIDPLIRSDGRGYHIWTRAILERDLSFRKYRDVQGIYPSDPRRDFYQNKYPPGLALLRLPVMAFLVDRSPGAPLISTAEHWANQALGGLALWTLCLLSLRTCRLLAVPHDFAHRSVLAVVFGTGLFDYATYDACFSHVYSALGVATFLCLGIRAMSIGNGRLPLVGTALTAFLFVLIRNTNLIVLAALTAAYIYARRRLVPPSPRTAVSDLAGVIVGAGGAGALQLAYNWYAQRALVMSSYDTAGDHFLWHRPMQRAVLVSYERGLFTYYPVFALIIAVGWAIRRTRLAAAWFSLTLLMYVFMYGFWFSWMLGCGFGHRGFIELAPIGIVLFAVVLRSLKSLWLAIVTVSAAACALVTSLLMLSYWAGTLPMCGAKTWNYWSSILALSQL